MVEGDSDRNDDIVFGWPWAEPRRTMLLLFHEMLLRCNTGAYTQTSQREQQLFNPRRVPGAPWVGSADRCPQPPLRDMLYVWCVFALHYDVAYIAEPLVYYRSHNINMSKIFTRDNRSVDYH